MPNAHPKKKARIWISRNKKTMPCQPCQTSKTNQEASRPQIPRYPLPPAALRLINSHSPLQRLEAVSVPIRVRHGRLPLLSPPLGGLGLLRRRKGRGGGGG
jgi:hypothetical protein